ncbi:hypothetical protein [Raineya sp.]
MENTFEVKLNLIFNMSDKTVKIKDFEVVEEPDKMSFRQKALAYFKKQEETLAEQLKKFEVGVAASELSEQFRIEKLMVETKYWQIKSYLQVLELL